MDKATSANWMTGTGPWTRGNGTRPQEDQRLTDLMNTVEKNIQTVEKNLETVEKNLEKNMQTVEKNMQTVEKNRQAVEKNMQAVETNRQAVEKNMQAVVERIQGFINVKPKVDWTSKWIYSKWIHDHTMAETPFEQVSIYIICLGSLLYTRKCWRTCHHLKRAAQLPVGSEERNFHQAMSRLTEAETRYANVVTNRLRTQGIFVGIGVPLLWLEYIRNKHNRTYL